MNKLKNCCIIDDDSIFIYGAKRIMKETDFCESIVVYNTGDDALLGIQETYQITHILPQVIFLDLNMPIISGWEFLDEFIKMYSDSLHTTDIYITSSSVDPRDIEKIKEYELIRNYILKPITTNDLKTILKNTLV